MEEKIPQTPQQVPHPIRIITLLYAVQTLIITFGIIVVLIDFTPFPEMKTLAYELKHGNILGIPGILFTSIDTPFQMLAAIGLYKMKRWSVYLFIISVLISIMSTIYAHAWPLSTLKGLELYALLIGLFYFRKLR